MTYDLIKIAARILFDVQSDLADGARSKRKQIESLSDELVVQQAQKELPYRTEAYEVLMGRYRHKVFGKLISMLKHREEAHDVMQDVMLKVFNGLPNFKGNSSFSTWLYTISVNTALNHIEKLRRRPWWWISEDVAEMRQDQAADASLFFQFDSGLEREDLQKLIEQVMESLPETAREIIHMRYFREMDYKAIADELKIGLSATKMRLKRAREEFKNEFESISQGEFYG